jgi:acyl dehydratase
MMTKLTLHQTLPPYTVVAKNYATHHDNNIHSDEGAARYGFAGGLVPGVANYAYLTRPVVETLGQEWLERGRLAAKFIHPIYDGETATVQGTVTQVKPLELQLELLNSVGKLCAVGTATLPDVLPPLNIRDFAQRALPEARRPATIAAVPAGTELGSLHFALDLPDETFLANMQETLALYRGADALCHPAFWPAQANEILMRNVALGPWIHTASTVQHYALARAGEHLSLRGRVQEAFEKRGHEIVVLDLGLFGVAERPLAHIQHSAIIKLRENS